jgi:hypothetical protein
MTWTGEDVEVLGTFPSSVECNGRKNMATFYVTNQGQKALICYNLARKLVLFGEVSNMNTSDDREALKIPQRVAHLLAHA